MFDHLFCHNEIPTLLMGIPFVSVLLYKVRNWLFTRKHCADHCADDCTSDSKEGADTHCAEHHTEDDHGLDGNGWSQRSSEEPAGE